MKQNIHTNKAPNAIGPYSQAVSYNDLIFTSGQIAIDPTTNKMNDESVETETKQVLENIKALLDSQGSGMQNILKCSIFLKNLNDFEVVNKIYSSYFESTSYPARETVQVVRLPKDARIEISVIAQKV